MDARFSSGRVSGSTRRGAAIAVVALFMMVAALLSPVGAGAQEKPPADDAPPLESIEPSEAPSLPSQDVQFEDTLPEIGPPPPPGGDEADTPLAPSVGASFPGTDRTTSGFIPPDTMGAVGPNHVVELINGQYAVYSKTGTKQTSSTLNAFWSAAGVMFAGAFTFDPRVVYDPGTNRFFAAAVDNGGAANNILVAVSNSSDPLTGWSGWAIDSDSDNLQWADFPMLGIDNTDIYVSANMFDINTGAPFANNVLQVNKASMIAGTPTSFLSENISSPSIWHTAVDRGNDGQTSALSAFSSGLLGIRTMNGSSVGTGVGVGVPAYSAAPTADQPGAKTNIETGGTRFGSYPVEEGNSIWAVHTVDVNGRAGLRWYEINKNTNTLTQWGTISHPSLAYFYPSINVNGAGDVVIGFSGTDPTTFVSAYAAVGTTTGGVTTFATPILLQAGSADYLGLDSINRNRWGDYSAVNLDPTDSCVFWTVQEYVKTVDNWGINFSQVNAGNPAPNDNLANAATLGPALPATDTENNTCATAEAGEPSHDNLNPNPPSHSLWWQWTAPANGSVTVDTEGSVVTDTVLGVYTGNNVAALNVIAKDDDSGTGLLSKVDFTATAGTTYKIAVDGWTVNTPTGNVTVNITTGPVGATCNGLPVTVDLNLGQVPTAGADVILGTPGPDVIVALGGDDTICAQGG
ncbi:MAG: pre-peptidase C-terminal domain-containing protein, partial [Acidimicrobiia bacterium]|nr:pre-peptidase C-terminal domain-containing protein [Acidimicrobiia bacterium]